MANPTLGEEGLGPTANLHYAVNCYLVTMLYDKVMTPLTDKERHGTNGGDNPTTRVVTVVKRY